MMSSLGTAVSWEFVEEWAESSTECDSGWTDTFDADYEFEDTAMTVWVSLRL